MFCQIFQKNAGFKWFMLNDFWMSPSLNKKGGLRHSHVESLYRDSTLMHGTAPSSKFLDAYYHMTKTADQLPNDVSHETLLQKCKFQ